MGKRNFGLGHRDMSRAGQIAISGSYESYSSKNTIHQRWNQFVKFIREQHCVKKMEDIRKEHIETFAEKLREENKEPATQQNYISAVNRVMEEARQDREVHVNPSEVCDRRSMVADRDKSISNEKHERILKEVDERTGAQIELQRLFGLRFQESSKINAQAALQEAEEKGKISLIYGTKGGQKREIEIRNENQIEALRRAAEIQGNDRSLIPGENTYKEFKDSAYAKIENKEFNFHGERHAYAQERYKEITGHEAPVKSLDREEAWIPFLARELGVSPQEAREIDSNARMQISEELGHHREDVIAAYLGGKG